MVEKAKSGKIRNTLKTVGLTALLIGFGAGASGLIQGCCDADCQRRLMQMEQEYEKPEIGFEGIICRNLEDGDESGKVGDSYKDFAGKDQYVFYADQGVTVCGVAWGHGGDNLTTKIIRQRDGALVNRWTREIDGSGRIAIIPYRIHTERPHDAQEVEKYVVEWFINGVQTERKTFVVEK